MVFEILWNLAVSNSTKKTSFASHLLLDQLNTDYSAGERLNRNEEEEKKHANCKMK